MKNNIITPGEASPPASPFTGTPAELHDLLGHDVVLLGWPLGSKGTEKKWGHLKAASMTAAYLRELAGGNIGVALGRVSGGLVALDIDDDSLVGPFMEANPFLKATLQTHGARGRVLWLRMRGEYPAKTIKLKNHAGKDCGEWRAGKNSQSIIAGIHPDTRKPYQVVNLAKPLVVDFDSIVWPTQISNPPKAETELPVTGTEEPEDTEDTEEPEEVGLSGWAAESGTSSVSSGSSGSSVPEWVFTVRSVEDALRVSVPSTIHQNYHAALQLARAVKALEIQTGKPFTPDQHRDIHKAWLTRAAKFLRPGQSPEDYFMEYLCAYRAAKFPLGSKVVAQALEAAKKNPLPPDALPWTDNPDLRLLVAVCRELQSTAGNEPFYLSNRMVKAIFQHETHSTGAQWLRSLCVMQIIEEVEKGKGFRASRYRYRKDLQQ